MHEARLVLLDLRIGQMRRQHRKFAPAGRHGLGHGAACVLPRNAPAGGGMGEHAVARPLRGLRKTIRPTQLWRLRQGHQQRGLGKRQPPRLLAEIGKRGGAHPFQVAAERCQAKVEAAGSRLWRSDVRDRARTAPAAACPPRYARARPGAGARLAWSASSRPKRCGDGAQAARRRGRSPKHRRRGVSGSVCPRRRSAWRDSADRPAPARRAGASDHRRWCRRAAGDRCDRAP